MRAYDQRMLNVFVAYVCRVPPEAGRTCQTVVALRSIVWSRSASVAPFSFSCRHGAAKLPTGSHSADAGERLSCTLVAAYHPPCSLMMMG